MLRNHNKKSKATTKKKVSTSMPSDLASTAATDLHSSEYEVSTDQTYSNLETPARKATEWQQLPYNVEEDSYRFDPSPSCSDGTESEIHHSKTESNYTYISNPNIGAISFKSCAKVNFFGAKIGKVVLSETVSKSESDCNTSLNDHQLIDMVKICCKIKYIDGIKESNYFPGVLPNSYISLYLEDPDCQTQHYIWKPKPRNALCSLFARRNSTYSLDDLSNVFSLGNHERFSRIIIEGQPGYGKSTLTKMMAFHWLTGTKLQEFSLVFLIELKKCNEGDIMDLVFQQLIKNAVFEDRHKVALREFVSKNEEKVLFVLDGFNELNECPCKENIMKLLSGDKFTASTVILTSRPFKLQEFTNTVSGITLRLTGFDCEIARASFIKKFFKYLNLKELGKKVKSTLLSNSKIENLTKCPLFLTLICKIYKDEPQIILDHNLHTTLTSLYCKLFTSLVRFNVAEKNPSKDGSFVFPPVIEDAFHKFGRLCLTTLMNEKVMFRENIFTDLNCSHIKDLWFLYKDNFTLPGEVVYYPKHQTFIEFLAAYYLSKLNAVQLQSELAIIYQCSQNDLKKLPCEVFYFLIGLIKENKEINLIDLIREMPKEIFANEELAKLFLKNILHECSQEQITEELIDTIKDKAPGLKLPFRVSEQIEAYLELLNIT